MDYLWDRKNIWPVSILVLAIVVSFWLGRSTTPPLIIKPTVLRESGYKYINPVLLCNTDNQQDFNKDVELNKKLADYSDNYSDTIAVSYLNLINGKWAEVDDNIPFSPASMLKVPTLIGVMKAAEDNPYILAKEVYYDGSFDDNKKEYFKPQKSIQAGHYYSIDELLTYMIEDSDNNALDLIHQAVNSTDLAGLYKDLNIQIPQNTIDFMSTRTYTWVLRVLYNSTYLSREMSERVLKLMTTHDFPQGIEAGVPDNIEVAEKFGERQIFNTQGDIEKKELHDCGIIYSDKPYILCIMTSRQDFKSLQSHIQDISKMVYDYIKNNSN